MQQQRFAFLGLVLAMAAPLGVRLAKEAGWLASPYAPPLFAAAMAIFCIAGGIIAYRTTRAQVRADLDEAQSAGRVNR